ncbi:MAG: type II toxin-antitoxin system HipA family toxin [Gordonia amarae]
MTDLDVYVDIAGEPVRAGTAYFTVHRSRVSTTFTYDSAYLAGTAGDLEPGLPVSAGQQYVDGLPGAFADSSPDRWGRNLIDKRRRAAQREASQRLPAATAIDYLVGVSDITRQGDLRFADSRDPDSFLAPGRDVPKLVSLPELLNAADNVSRSDALVVGDLDAVKSLLDAGSGSLGGARPKASVRADDGRLLIAKFPHPGDEWDVMAWEKTTLDLAEAAGITAPRRRLTRVGTRNVLLVERFDRSGSFRVGYISAMTLLGARDGDERDYADIAEVLPAYGASVKADLAELFRRVVFNVAIHNTDDHLRNHGFLRAKGGWSLSPVFDVNPEPDVGKRRVTGIVGSSDDEPAALLALADECRLSRGQTSALVGDVVAAVAGWRDTAQRNGIGPGEIELFADAVENGLALLGELT